ncbi:MAG: RagB/SusD family nutrient uptake outer membrane protein [Muribaculaceae bacterium]|nr:RagB/SusD family nutrient uptake outer membrane protein [Muribaculaceae bacterium]
MKKIVSTLAIAGACLALTSCDDLFEPAQENNLGLEYMYNNPSYAEGILANAYTRIPIGSYPWSEVATDDAVSNDADNSWRRLAAGTWRADNNPTERWQNCRAAIQYLNLFLANAEKVAWNTNETLNKMYCDREMGEAYALRAMYMYYLLEAHAGYTADGELLGVPIVTEPETQASNFNAPRNTFAECVDAMRADAAKALELLPLQYGKTDEMERLHARYPETNINNVNRVFGTNFVGRIDGHIVEAFLAKLDLMGASPRFANGSGITWEDAAKSAATVINRVGGVQGVDPTGYTWYCNVDDIENLRMADLPLEVLWAGERGKGNGTESENYPPTLYGNGRINPSQNFVDAFPMANGYPITDSRSGYSKNDPYSGRDPRLATYVLYNGSQAGLTNTTINTAANGSTNDALNKVNGKSTRTGYYLKKLMRQDISLDPSAKTEQNHYTPRIRYTEMFLTYAEAANEAYGPTGKGNQAYSAYDVIKAIRARAGVGAGNDAYLESIKGDKDKMRELIRNERRIELSFEGHRFWDLRRWMAPLNETVTGMSIEAGPAGVFYEVIDVENRQYGEHMNYGPIPYSEVLKFSELKQNKGW